MTQEEVEEWLAHIPVFAVTDSKGSGVVLKPDDDSSVFYFFMSPQMANATLTQLKGSNDDLDLRISAFSLGKIWFKILQSKKSVEVKVCQKKRVCCYQLTHYSFKKISLGITYCFYFIFFIVMNNNTCSIYITLFYICKLCFL